MPLSKSHEPAKRPKSPIRDRGFKDFEGFDSDEPMEKDGTEIELEKLVFGDKSGFLEGLKAHKDASNVLRGLVNDGRGQAQDGLEEGDLGRLDDADVCKLELPLRLAFAQ